MDSTFQRTSPGDQVRIPTSPVHTAQALSYMKLTDVPLGLLINFNVPVLKDGIKRLAL